MSPLLPYITGFEPTDGFKDGNLDQQGGWTVDAGTATIERNSGREGSQGLTIQPSTPHGQVSLRLAQPAAEESGIIFSDFYIRPAASADQDDSQFADVDGAITGFFKIDRGGELQVLNGNGENGGAWQPTGVTFATAADSDLSEDWIRLTLRQDFIGKVWDLFVNGKAVAWNLGFWSNEAKALDHFSIMGHSSFPLHFDNLHIATANMLFPDENCDGVPDSIGDRNSDADGDGLTVVAEILAGTHRGMNDSDQDGMFDGSEIKAGRDLRTMDFFTRTSAKEKFASAAVLPLPFGRLSVSTAGERRAAAAALT